MTTEVESRITAPEVCCDKSKIRYKRSTSATWRDTPTEKLAEAWERNDVDAMRELIHEKVKAEDFPHEKHTCHLSDKIFDVFEEKKKEETKGRFLKGVKEKFHEFHQKVEFADDDEDRRRSFMEVFFDDDEGIEMKLNDLKPSEWTKEHGCQMAIAGFLDLMCSGF